MKTVAVVVKRGSAEAVALARQVRALVSNPNIDDFGILRQKLHWGER